MLSFFIFSFYYTFNSRVRARYHEQLYESMLYHIMGAFAENWNLSDDAEASQPSNDVVSGKTLEILNSILLEFLEFLWIPSNFWKFILSCVQVFLPHRTSPRNSENGNVWEVI